jgi:dipeptidyl aminopeptidase/acylaminoacyl peptidase
MSRRLQLEDLFRIALPSDPRLAPDATAVAHVLTTVDRDGDENVSSLWLAPTGAGAGPPRRLTFGRHDTAPRWSPDGRWLAFLRSGDGPPQLSVMAADGGEPRPVTNLDLGAGEPVWSPDSTRIAFAAPVGAVDPNAPVVIDTLEYKADGAGLLRGLRKHLFVVPVDDGPAVQVTEGDFHAGTPRWSPDGDRLAFAASRDPDRDLAITGAAYVVPVGDGPAEPARVSEGDTVVAEVVDWLADDRLLVAGLRGPAMGHTRLYTLAAAGGVPAEVVTGLDRNVMTGAPGYPGGVPQVTGDTLVFCVRDRGCTHVYAVPVSGGRAHRLVGAPDLAVSGVSVVGDRIAYVASTPGTAGDIHVATLGGREQRRITDLALTDVELLAPVEREFTAPDGTTVHGFVLRDPAATAPGPLLLDAHGGPHNAWAPTFDGVHLYHQVLAAAGWTVLTLNVRGSDGYGESFYTAVVGGWGTADLDDFLAPVDALVAEGTADPDRLAVCGYSYGGYTACWLPTQTDRFAAAVAGGCVADLVSLAGTSDAGHLLAAHEIGDLPHDDPGRYAKHSPLAHVANVRTPTLLLHGEVDHRCPVGQAEQWFTALRERGVPTRLVRYPGAGHLFILDGRPSHRLDFNRRIVEWVQQWT